MKQLFFFCLLFCVYTRAYTQLEEQSAKTWQTIGELKPLGSTKAKMEMTVNGNDTVYMLLMKDFTKQRETKYFSISFNNSGDAFNKFHALLLSFFSDENKADRDYMRTVKLGQTMVNIQRQALIGMPGIRLTTNDGYITFSKHDINKVFGKLGIGD